MLSPPRLPHVARDELCMVSVWLWCVTEGGIGPVSGDRRNIDETGGGGYSAVAYFSFHGLNVVKNAAFKWLLLQISVFMASQWS